jgi:hypothetical protein
MADLATLQGRLAEAEEALHQLRIGKRVAQIRHGERSVQYTEAAKLEAYIADLKNQIARLQGNPGRRPIQLWPR